MLQPLGRSCLQHEPVARLALLRLSACLWHEELHQQPRQRVTELEPTGCRLWEPEARSKEPVTEEAVQTLEQLPALPEERRSL